MYQKFLTARSPLRLLEKGLHGGLGRGNIGLVLAGHGVGKTAFLVGVALDDLIQGGHVLHVALDQTVSHARAYYDTVFDDLASSTHLEDEAVVHADADRRRSIRAYPPGGFDAAKLREAIKFEEEAGNKPGMVILEGLEASQLGKAEVDAIRAVASEIDAEMWLSVACAGERISGAPDGLDSGWFDVVLALEPDAGHISLRAIKDHDNPDVSALHVALDPKTLLLTRG